MAHRLADQLTRTGLQQADTSVDQQALPPALQVVELGVVQRQEQLPWASQVLQVTFLSCDVWVPGLAVELEIWVTVA